MLKAKESFWRLKGSFTKMGSDNIYNVRVAAIVEKPYGVDFLGDDW